MPIFLIKNNNYKKNTPPAQVKSFLITLFDLNRRGKIVFTKNWSILNFCAISFQDSSCFEQEEAVGEIHSPKLIHKFKKSQNKIILFSQTLLLDISKLLSPTEFNQMQLLIASLFLPKISNLPRVGSLEYFLINLENLTNGPAISNLKIIIL